MEKWLEAGALQLGEGTTTGQPHCSLVVVLAVVVFLFVITARADANQPRIENNLMQFAEETID